MTTVTEEAKRLQPKGETLRELFLKSGNLCAFPGCGALMMDADGTFIGQVCHIEAAEDKGERFNRHMTNEARRQPANLMLMCYAHHQKTNDVSVYTVAKMTRMKADHEKRFSHPDRAILEKLTDWTEADEPSHATNLIRLDAAVGWGHAPIELAESANELKDYVDRLRHIPIDLRRFVGAVAKRAAKMEQTNAVHVGFGGIRVLVSDLAGAFRLSERAIGERAKELNAYGVGDLDVIDTDFGPKAAVRIRHLNSGWRLWSDLARFCEVESEPMEAFTEDLDFARLDG